MSAVFWPTCEPSTLSLAGYTEDGSQVPVALYVCAAEQQGSSDRRRRTAARTALLLFIVIADADTGGQKCGDRVMWSPTLLLFGQLCRSIRHCVGDHERNAPYNNAQTRRWLFKATFVSGTRRSSIRTEIVVEGTGACVVTDLLVAQCKFDAREQALLFFR